MKNILNFGKYEGKEIEKVYTEDRGYFNWLVEKALDLNSDCFKASIKVVLEEEGLNKALKLLAYKSHVVFADTEENDVYKFVAKGDFVSVKRILDIYSEIVTNFDLSDIMDFIKKELPEDYVPAEKKFLEVHGTEGINLLKEYRKMLSEEEFSEDFDEKVLQDFYSTFLIFDERRPKDKIFEELEELIK